jgi:hypothetical protein
MRDHAVQIQQQMVTDDRRQIDQLLIRWQCIDPSNRQICFPKSMSCSLVQAAGCTLGQARAYAKSLGDCRQAGHDRPL